MEDRGDEAADRDRHDQGGDRPLAADRKVRADDHQRTHQQEDQRHAEGVELVLERRCRVEVAAGQPDEAEDDDRRAAQGNQVQPDHDRQGERAEGEGKRPALGQPALDDRVAGSRAGDRVDALAHVVDLVDDVRARMDQHRADEGREERRPGEQPVDCGECRTGQDRDHRRGVGERPEDLPGRSQPPPGQRAGSELAVVSQSDRYA